MLLYETLYAILMIGSNEQKIIVFEILILLQKKNICSVLVFFNNSF